MIAVSAEIVPSFEGVCPRCTGEENHLPDCAIAIEEAAAEFTVAEATCRREYSCGFWAGLDVPAVRFWNAVIALRLKTESV